MNLKEFLLIKMKMSGIYQPLIIKHLLQGNGKASLKEIAQDLATNDQDIIDDFIERLKIHPRTVLKKHGVATISGNEYVLSMELGDSKEALIKLCDDRIRQFLETGGTVSGKPAGWGLKRIFLITQKPFCELCGARPSQNAQVVLDIDHIKPSSKGGSDDIENLQVLCSKCNRAKGNNLLPSASHVHQKYLNHKNECVFCSLESERVIYQDEYVKVFKDAYPVTKDHTLIVPVRHIETALELTPTEISLIFQKAKEVSELLEIEDGSIKGFNLGFNVGEVAGQTVGHAHFHIIPRRIGDVEDPVGGIRNIFPGKGNYKKTA